MKKPIETIIYPEHSHEISRRDARETHVVTLISADTKAVVRLRVNINGAITLAVGTPDDADETIAYRGNWREMTAQPATPAQGYPTPQEMIDRVHIGTDAEGVPTLTIDGDKHGKAAEAIVRYVGRRAMTFAGLAQSLYFPADNADRRHRRNIAALVRRHAD